MRVKSSIKNTIVGLVAQIIYQLLNFACRTVLIKVLGVTYLGLNSLFANILSLFSIAEFGFGTVIIINMYKPIAEGDHEKIKSLLRAYKIIYMVIGAGILVAGMLVIPFIGLIVGEIPDVPYNIIIVYLLILSNSVFGYFFSFKRSIIIASQKRYVDNINAMVFYAVKNILMILAICITKNYLIYLIIQPLLLIAENISISAIADRIFPYIKGKASKLSKEDFDKLKKNTFSIVLHKTGDVIVFATDSILISIFLGVATVGYFANYQLLVSIASIVVMLFITQVGASVGNLVTESNKENAYDVFKRIMFLHFWILGFCSIALVLLTQSFIKIWLGNEFLLPTLICVANTVCFYLRYSREAVASFKEATGLFKKDKYMAIVKAVVNLGVSILLLIYVGLIGVIIGTIVCLLATNLWIEPILVYKYYFAKNPLLYFARYLIYTGIIVAVCLITWLCIYFIPDGGIMLFLLKMLVCTVVPNLLFLLIYFKAPEFKYFINLLKREKQHE